jgi:hypothetical protein
MWLVAFERSGVRAEEPDERGAREDDADGADENPAAGDRVAALGQGDDLRV